MQLCCRFPESVTLLGTGRGAIEAGALADLPLGTCGPTAKINILENAVKNLPMLMREETGDSEVIPLA
jgi:hypothetical protein